MSLKLRKADLRKDGRLLKELDNLSFSRDFDMPSMSVEEEVKFLRSCQTYIYYKDNKPVGFYSYIENMGEVELKGIAVIPDFQNKGIGRKMTEDFLSKIKGKRSFLVTHPKNSGAIILYLKCGYEITGWKENYYGDGQPRLRLNRPAV